MKRIFWFETAAVAVMLGVLLVLSWYGISVKGPDVDDAVVATAASAVAFAAIAVALATCTTVVFAVVIAVIIAVIIAGLAATVTLAVAFAAIAAAFFAIAAVAVVAINEQDISKPRAFISLVIEALIVGVATWCVVQNHIFLATLASAVGIVLLTTVCFAPFRRLAFSKPAESK